jgi:hypothetical protein
MNELRKRIAELKGYQPLNKTALDDTLTPVNLWRYEGERICDEDIPAWDEDIAAAFELVEEMRAAGFEIIIINYNLAEGWTVSAQKHTRFDDIIEYSASDAELPGAICKVWIAWKEIQP